MDESIPVAEAAAEAAVAVVVLHCRACLLHAVLVVLALAQLVQSSLASGLHQA